MEKIAVTPAVRQFNVFLYDESRPPHRKRVLVVVRTPAKTHAWDFTMKEWYSN
jgi:hypothetical protein